MRGRVELLLSAGAVLTWCALICVPPLAARPNVLFIAVDDLRPQLGCYGDRGVISPHIDALARAGVRFSRAYCQVPVCGASRASLLTGLRPTRERFVSYKTYARDDAPGVASLPQCFRDQGYRTISNGKIFHHADDHRKAWTEPVYRPRDFCAYVTDENKALMKTTPRGRGLPYEAGDVPDNAYPDGRATEKVIRDLRAAKRDGTPFFVAAGYAKPHLPFVCPRKYWDLYDAGKIRLPDNYYRAKGAPDAAFHTWGELRSYAGVPPKGPLPEEMALKLIHGYNACVSYTDAMIGRVLAELDRLGLRQSTIVVLWGDHGWQLGEHTLWCKHCNFNTSLQVPLLISAPGYDGDAACEALVEFVDIYPTLCELADIEKPAHLEGSSMVPLLRNPAREWKTAVFSRYYNGSSVRTDRYLYTEWHRGETCYARMLYDHRADPDENRNTAELPGNAALVLELSRMLREGWRKQLP